MAAARERPRQLEIGAREKLRRDLERGRCASVAMAGKQFPTLARVESVHRVRDAAGDECLLLGAGELLVPRFASRQ